MSVFIQGSLCGHVCLLGLWAAANGSSCSNLPILCDTSTLNFRHSAYVVLIFQMTGGVGHLFPMPVAYLDTRFCGVLFNDFTYFYN